jgi:hypothetical protein
MKEGDVTETWTIHYKGTVGGRPIEVRTYSEGGYQVCTTQGADDNGGVISNEPSPVIMPFTAKGRPIKIDGGTVDEIREQLAAEGFDEQEIEEIVSHFPST